ncbi:D-alanyl-D-alanine carboxypeptidase family protein [Psychrobacter sp. NPDC078370]|jgi:D-alanyl-D-alanine carboxypeptidase (penicillin-binding protein 5/6)|nr:MULTISPECIES: D-alanyl-D-alanine carboxypeptidase family protein [Psychrobacter]MBA6245139.1 D-alanyl-D-alanine carboxypeptidase [Psychrobacter sp. Urea-trap-18]MBA6286742.1 D-alanyl-D-alanine carboxypeptidase [Psychrobacter sp. Urea-trap-16]MBA6317799.1 D-alanyl-D-alanine carboxypeptidase [Psychrobacter sp. Urea-trap-20]MBA6334466.1 D-alanyl-D-alanine carboxypeptidase [Psychrobacter sp. Urea-trap-19]OEH68481.1 MAG: serine-type D-Ala-D-Ala carboxypeptidase [Psychrobacter sp. B29-1]|tara:strand:- start:88018 stop:89184 length:1167 start_codon:yes stop_codon:yes gene_type:complete
MTVKRVKNQLIQLVVGVSISMSAVVANAAIQPPEMDNTAYVLMDYNTGEILAQKNANEALPPASLTKMMTSYIIEQRLASGDLKEDEQVLMSPNAWCRGSSSQSCMYVPVNKTASVIDMLRGIIIQSGNDASKAMAEHIAGSEASFAILMNEQAQKIGMENSNFVNATGMPDEGHLASALDLSKLARAIIKNSGDYYSIYAEKEFTYNGITQGNRNALLITDPTVDGLKTGHTDAAGYCLVASSNREGMRLISVIMGTKSQQARADQSRELLNWGFGHFTTVTKAPAGQFVSKLPVWFGEADEVELATGDNLQILTSKTQKNKITTVVDIPESLEAPIKKGQEVGKMMAVIDGKAVASVPIIATNDIEQSGFMSRTWEHIVRWVKNLF